MSPATPSVLLPDTAYFREAAIPVKSIVETSAEPLLRELEADPRSVAMIFGTQTTIDAGAYPRLLESRSGRVAHQSGLPASPTRSPKIVKESERGQRSSVGVGAAIEKMQRTDRPVVACLACTHYGYRKDLFAGALADAGIRAKVVNGDLTHGQPVRRRPGQRLRVNGADERAINAEQRLDDASRVQDAMESSAAPAAAMRSRRPRFEIENQPGDVFGWLGAARQILDIREKDGTPRRPR